ncbi:hypothetical protein THAOC_21147, partial [Thalassiosira oceanica]
TPWPEAPESKESGRPPRVDGDGFLRHRLGWEPILAVKVIIPRNGGSSGLTQDEGVSVFRDGKLGVGQQERSHEDSSEWIRTAQWQTVCQVGNCGYVVTPAHGRLAGPRPRPQSTIS